MVFLALAVILAAVAVVLYRKLDIKAVRDELSGRTAEREIKELRGVRAGSWQRADELGDHGARKRKKGKSGASATGSPTGTGDTSDIEFRPVTGTGSGSWTGSGSMGSTNAGVTRPSTSAPRHAVQSVAQPAADQPVVEIPVSMASAAELADEGETSLMQFRKPAEHTDDDDESRTILVRGGKKH
ncbi:hypothetical protein F7D09_1324 [Bifidobacterium leontopitheci]|uniref:Uncharacterized protein n=1 Tax=Bifidobacterium leontopitheci TaxID=2650774 RepID=A0A6I1GQ18_9BIFI|nr:hypothetical protein F7D09_1324 [Bifidobacterium leontopitheci]